MVRENLKKSGNFKTSQKSGKTLGISKLFKSLRNFKNIQKSKFFKILKSMETFKIIQKNRETVYELGIYQHCLIFYLNNPPPLFNTFQQS